MEEAPSFNDWHGSIKSYLIGFFSSLILTLIAFSLVVFKRVEGRHLITILVSLALVQAIIQLRFFLHLGQEDSPKWETWTFYFMVLVLLILTLGSLWIMADLDARMMGGM